MRTGLLAAVVLGLGIAIGLAIGLSLRPEPPAPVVRERPVAGAPAGNAAADVPPEAPDAPVEAPVIVDSVARSPLEAALGGRPVEDADRPLADRIRMAIEQDLRVHRRGGRQLESVPWSLPDALAALAAEHEVVGGPSWILADAEAGAVVLRALLEGAGIALDEAQVAAIGDLAARVAAPFAVASDPEQRETERVALRRRAEVEVERGIVDLLHSGQVTALETALAGRAAIGALPGGDERDTMSSTGSDAGRMTTMVISSYRDRLGLPAEVHRGVQDAVETYVSRVGDLNRSLAARWGSGFVEAVSSGPTPHTEAARSARAEPGYALRELEARAELWRLQADLERDLDPYLDDEARERLRMTRPTALRFVLTER